MFNIVFKKIENFSLNVFINIVFIKKKMCILQAVYSRKQVKVANKSSRKKYGSEHRPSPRSDRLGDAEGRFVR